MTLTVHVASASLFTVVSIFAIGSAGAGEAKPNPDFPPVVTDQPSANSTAFPPVEGQDIPDQTSGAGQTSFPPVEESSAPAPKDLPPVESDASSGHKSSSSADSGSTSGSRKKRKSSPPVASSSDDSDTAEERHRHHDRQHHEAKQAIKRFLREHGGFISNFSRSRPD